MVEALGISLRDFIFYMVNFLILVFVLGKFLYKPFVNALKDRKQPIKSAMENAELSLKGRHDPCIVPRAVPCVEAAAAIAIYDAYLSWKKLH